jgi:hypothetical protein
MSADRHQADTVPHIPLDSGGDFRLDPHASRMWAMSRTSTQTAIAQSIHDAADIPRDNFALGECDCHNNFTLAECNFRDNYALGEEGTFAGRAPFENGLFVQRNTSCMNAEPLVGFAGRCEYFCVSR